MIFEGKCLTVKQIEDGIAELNFDLHDSSVNKLNLETINELKDAVAALSEHSGSVKGLLISSGKKDFIVGADIFEFLNWFALPEQDFEDRLLDIHKTFAAIEDFPFPTICAVNGVGLGGGFELPLSKIGRAHV